jgi:hypothetical protein
MRFIRLILISFVFLFVLASLIGALLPAHVLVSRAVNIHASTDSVLAVTGNIQAWKGWMEGMNDASVKIKSPAEAQIGQTLVTIEAVTDSSVVSKWLLKSGQPQTSTIRVYYQPAQQLTIVQWQFEQSLRWYPWERIGSIMNDKIMGPMMEKNLAGLKQFLEKPQVVQ